MGSKRSRADVAGCVPSLVDALVCLTFLVLPPTPATGGRLWILLLLDPVTCVICYWVMYQRLLILRPKHWDHDQVLKSSERSIVRSATCGFTARS
jgi:hypothetical protein